MKVKVRLVECHYYECSGEVEMTKKEYNEYLKTGHLKRETLAKVSDNDEGSFLEKDYINWEIV